MTKKVGWWRENLASLVMSAVAAIALVTTAVIQAVDQDPPPPLDCYVVRGEVLSQAESEPGTLELHYPEDSREESECNINEFMDGVTDGPQQQPSGAEQD